MAAIVGVVTNRSLAMSLCASSDCLFVRFYLKFIILQRQARDKHRENSPTSTRFSYRCASNGVLLQPSFPLTAVDGQLAGNLPLSITQEVTQTHTAAVNANADIIDVGADAEVEVEVEVEGGPARPVWTQNAMATYTTIGTGSAATTSFIVAAFIWRASPTVTIPPRGTIDTTWTLHADDLSTLIDCDNYPPAAFRDVPNGSYKDRVVPTEDTWQQYEREASVAGNTCPPFQRPGVIWMKGAESAAPFSWAAAAWAANDDDDDDNDDDDDAAAEIEMQLSESPVLAYVSPITGQTGIALIGEEGKVAMLSTYRFAAIESEGARMHVRLRGEAGETVTLVWVYVLKDDYDVRRTNCTIGAEGTSNVTITGAQE